MKTLFVLDAVSLLFRSYYAIKKMTNHRGQSTNALYGFIRSVQKIIKDFSPTHLVAVFDGPNNKESRQKIYKEYKEHRKGMPDDLAPQLALAVTYCSYAGLPHLMEPGFEADDVIGGIALWAADHEVDVRICSSDKDLCQLVSDRIQLIHTHKNNRIITKEVVEELYQVRPEQIVDYLALMGDASDNIPGIPGVGPKTAASLLKEHATLDHLLNSLDQLPNRRLAEKIATHREAALMSQKLARLIVDLSFPKDQTFYAPRPPQLDKLTSLYQEMNFASLLKELKGPLPYGGDAPSVDFRRPPTLVDDPASLKKLVDFLATCDEICFDTETTAAQPMRATLVGIGFGVAWDQTWYLPLNGELGRSVVIEAVKPLFENPHRRFYGHNIKYDLHVLRNEGIELATIGFDTIIASYLINPHLNRHSLDALALELFGFVKTPLKELIGTGKKERSMRDVAIEEAAAYCAEDVAVTCQLKFFFEKELKRCDLLSVFLTLELPLIPVLAAMEHFGMYLDVDALHSMASFLETEIAKVRESIHTLAGESFNVKSPKQLSSILFEKLQIKLGNKKWTTRADVLESIQDKHPIIPQVLTFRFLEKLRSTYVQALPLQVHPKTHRIHCSFKQFVTATGRLSCQDPNLQNIPAHSTEGKKIRAAFRPENPTWRYLAADYSQIELRLLAHFSQDEALIQAFHNRQDIHRTTAAAIFDCPVEAVTKEQRSQAKAVNFGIIYGQQAFGLSKQLGIAVKEAAAFIATYFERYPKVRAFLENCKEQVRTTGFAETMTGRKRPIPEIHSPNALIRQGAERLAVNTPLQGSQADIIKKAMIAIQSALAKASHPAYMVLQIHDELIFELPEENVPEVKKIVVDLMENAAHMSVPLTVNIALGKNWEEC